MQRKIDVSHLVYIIIIFIIVLSFFLVIAFGGLKNADTMMGTASTVSSLILSVVAIVLSLIDVAGQRQSVIDLKETADKLKDSNEKSLNQINLLKEKLIEVSDLKEGLLDQVNKNIELREDITEILNQSREKVNNNIEKPAELNTIINDINKKFDLISKSLKTSNNVKRVRKYRIIASLGTGRKAYNLKDVSNAINDIVTIFDLSKDIEVEVRNDILRLTYNCPDDYSLDTGKLVEILDNYNMSWVTDGFVFV